MKPEGISVKICLLQEMMKTGFYFFFHTNLGIAVMVTSPRFTRFPTWTVEEI